MNNGKSWKTTTGGVGMVLAGLAYFIAVITGQTPITFEGATAAFTGISGGIALIFAKDSNVTGAGHNGTMDDAKTVK